ncbi:hypothetical protein GCM10011369_05920 [Neiella marina]|uniref:Uncharacterized protein n=1 Tax=Neiella marina TaxID=508461 RepID=A0A8J2U2N2_9GAMM|nr:hypothetical protein [Neiella marina]GGA67104.1 hypothetical protein GCM10011369_05920 [Neiella marina]
MDDIYAIPLDLICHWITLANQNDFFAVARLTELFGSVDEAQKFLDERSRPTQ